MAFARGFKIYANQIAESVWREMRLQMTARLDPLRLADWLDIPVWSLSSFDKVAPDLVKHFMTPSGRQRFSAFTVPDGERRAIVVNDSHAQVRQASSITHEVAHALLRHPHSPVLSEDEERNWDGDIESEAGFLGYALLIPFPKAIQLAKSGVADSEIATALRVSQSVVKYRLGATGARTIVARSRARYGRESVKRMRA